MFYDRTKAMDCFKEEENVPYGHWEKKIRTVDKYFHVSGQRPSNLPNSFIVSKDEAELGIMESPRLDDRYNLNQLN